MADPRTLLLLGATGFAGARLAALLSDAGFSVVATSRRAGAADLVCDLGDAASVDAAVSAAAPDAVVNLAGVSSASRSFDEVSQTFEANTMGTVSLLDSVARHAPGAYVLCVSSGDVYGSLPSDRLPATEECALEPASPYAASKAAMEVACRSYAAASGLAIGVVRAFNHTGPGQSDAFAASSFARQIAEAERRGAGEVVLRTGDLDLVRDFSDVRDIVRAYLAMIEGGVTGTFNAGSGRGIRLRELVDLLAAETDLSVEVAVDSGRLRPSEPRALYGSTDRLRAATGWTPELPLERTLGDLLEWWRERVREWAPAGL